MNKTLVSLLATAAIVSAAPATAQTWQNIDERQVRLDQRIDAAVRGGDLTGAEAARLRAEFEQIAELEDDYRRDGLSAGERAELDRRFDRLALQIRDERHDGVQPRDGQWENIDERQVRLHQRIDAGVRSGDITGAEAARLRAEFQQIAQLEGDYRRDGLSAGERAELDRRFDRLALQIRNGSHDSAQAEDGRWENIDERQVRLSQRIDAGVRSGDITGAEAARLRAEFQQIAQLEADYRRDGLSVGERAELDRRFDRLVLQIRDEHHDGEQASDDRWQNINERQARLDQRIDAGVRSGQLSRSEADRLRAEFQAIARLENDYRRDGLTVSERAELDRRFDRLALQIRDERHDGQQAGDDRWQNINERQARLDQRIDAGVRSGQLSRSEADRLRAEFQAIARLENDYRRDGLTVSERAELDRRFDRLALQIRDERHDGQQAGDNRWQNINERQARLDQRIDAGVRSGQLSRSEANRLRAEFQAIARLENDYRRDGLTVGERAELDRRFDRLALQIRDERHDGQHADGRWENLNQRQAQFQQRLDIAVRDRRLTQRQAINLTAEFRSIATIEQQYRRDGLSGAERADLNRRFDRLQTNFRASVAANQYGYGYGQAPNLFDYLFGIR